MTAEITEKENKPALHIWANIVWIIISYLILGGVFQLIGMLTAGVSLAEISNNLKDISLKQQLTIRLFGFSSLIIIVYIFRKFIDRKSIKSLGFSFKNRINDLIAGFIIAFLMIGSGTLILYAFGYVEVINMQINTPSLLLSFLLFIIVSLNEEILIRGYVLNNLMSSMNKYLALIISSIIFTLFHSFNPNLSLFAVVNLLLAGIILGSTYIFTKNLWFPISLHLFWNFFQGPIFGYSVSGQKIESMLTIRTKGNVIMHGGDFGFEGSIINSILLVFAIVLIFGYYIRSTKR